jgi:ribonuclease HII
MAARVVRSFPDFEFERAWWGSGYPLVAGVDEVGRGALAGPLVAAAVILPCGDASSWTGLTDSKLHVHEQRLAWSAAIRERAVACSIGVVDCDELDELGLGPANRIAMERAVLGLDVEPSVVLLDAMVTELPQLQVGLIDGDATSLSIAAASVLAKTTRDLLMVAADDDFPVFGFAAHKGYGTLDHLAALRTHGPCAIHRRCFAPVAALCGDV